jgi:uncharacterized protein (DUF427 family)
VNPDLFVEEQHPQRLHRGTAHLHSLWVGDIVRPSSARIYAHDAVDG